MIPDGCSNMLHILLFTKLSDQEVNLHHMEWRKKDNIPLRVHLKGFLIDISSEIYFIKDADKY